MKSGNPVPGVGGDCYVPYEERSGNESIVYFTRDLSPEGLQKIYRYVNGTISGKTAVKVHTGEKNGPNIIPPSWVRQLMESDIPNSVIVETNTAYKGDRYTTEDHRETLQVNGWTFCPVDILDEEGTVNLPVEGGKWLDEVSMGSHLTDYESLVILTHFKGHIRGGFGGSNKNIGIGCADGRIGKNQIHSSSGALFDLNHEEFMERMTESSKAILGFFKEKYTCVNLLRNMSVSCDCEGCAAQPVVTPNIGIVASTDILAVDQASMDLVYALKESDHADLLERIVSRHGHRQLSYMKELGMGNNRYVLIDIDNGNSRIWPADAVAGVVPFQG